MLSARFFSFESAGSIGGTFWPHIPKSKGERQLFLALLLISGATLLLLAIFYALNPSSIVGESLVTTQNGTPEEFPPPSAFPFYVKPVTIFFVALVVFSYCFFALAVRRIDRFPRGVRAFLLVISVVAFAVSTYEVLFNFTLWGSLLVSNPNPDLAVNTYPVGKLQTNLVFATKAYVALLFVSYFALATFRRYVQSE